MLINFAQTYVTCLQSYKSIYFCCILATSKMAQTVRRAILLKCRKEKYKKKKL